MAFKFNPFTGNFGIVQKVIDFVKGPASSTDNGIAVYDGTDGKTVKNTGVTIDASNNVIIPGDLTVNGTTTTVNSTNLDVTDKNITINDTGNDASAEGAGLTVERTGTDGSFVYENALTSKWKLGAVGSEVEVADISSTQTFTNKTINADSNTITNIDNADIKALAAIEATKIHDGSVDNTEFGHLNGVTSGIQGQIDGKLTSPLTTKGDIIARDASTEVRVAVGADDQVLVADSTQSAGIKWAPLPSSNTFDITTGSGVFSAVDGKTYIVDTSGGAATVTMPAPAANSFVRFKDNGNANTNNITVNPNAAETIDGASSLVMDSDYGAKVLISDGTNWYIL